MADDTILAIQVGSSPPQIHRGMSLNDSIEVITRADESLGRRMQAAEQQLSAIQAEVLTDPDMVVEYYIMQHVQSQRDQLLSCDLEDLTPESQQKRVEQYHRYTTPGSALLYRDAGFSGGSKFFTTTWPNFKWWPYKFNDVASSAKAWGGNILFEHTWYRGKKLYMIGVPYIEFSDLKKLDFNDIASSFVSLG